MRFAAVVFDLDGTLLDTLEDIANAANEVLKQLGHPQHATDAYRHFVGEGVARLFERALPAHARGADDVERCVERFRAIYGRAWNICTRPYPGVVELLAALREYGLKLAILSNKPHEFTIKCAEHHFAELGFEIVLGQRQGLPRKPDAAGALEIAAAISVPPAEALYVGDTGTDMQTAVNAGMYPVGVAWGYRPRSELLDAGAAAIITRPAELLELLGGS